MERMEQIDRELEQLGRELEDGARLEARMRDLEEQRRERQAKVEETAGRLQLEQRDGDISILELNVTLPETEESKS